MKRLDRTEIIFKILSYTFLTLFALCCLYPFIYVLSASLSSKAAVDAGLVVLTTKNSGFLIQIHSSLQVMVH